MNDSPDTSGSAAEYRVLARKYRPTTFDALVGQDALVRTLTNAITSGRIAQAYMLTGVRGIGKTTTARLIARALNCIGPDGTGGPTTQPCGVCEHCTAIAEDRHVDVLEMDAASRTGVNDIRELIEGVRYRPTSARYKVYIIDEVHMLSTAAFNALLKTLEEPPEHVKFIFATTEIRKVPVTVLSRCQRFDLRRVSAEELAGHFGRIAEKEGASIEDGALALIARAADGSVRDGLSLLDQAIAHAEGTVQEAVVRDMLGLADRAQVFDLFDVLMKGDIKTALDTLNSQYAAGADPAVVVQDMLEVTHWVTRAKVDPASLDDPAVAETERVRGKQMADGLTMAVLSRTWQMLLKALGEIRTAPHPLQAAEMALVRLAYAADLPSPAEAVEQLKNGGGAPNSGPRPSASGAPAAPQGGSTNAYAPSAQPPSGPPTGAPTAQLAQSQPQPEGPQPATFLEVVELFREKKEVQLLVHLREHLHLVSFQPGRFEFRPTEQAPKDLAQRLIKSLRDWTGSPWVVSVSGAEGEPTLKEQELTGAMADPVVQAIIAAFPDSKVGTIRAKQTDPVPGLDAGLPGEPGMDPAFDPDIDNEEDDDFL